MKFRLGCVLFGHCFITTQDFIRKKDGHPMIQATPVNYCSKCGLLKKELGLK